MQRDDAGDGGGDRRRRADDGAGTEPWGAVHARRKAHARQQGHRHRPLGDHSQRERVRNRQRVPGRRRSARVHLLRTALDAEHLRLLRRRRVHRRQRRGARHSGSARRDARPRPEGRRRRPLGDLAELRRRHGDRQHLSRGRRRAGVRGLHADRRVQHVRLCGRRRVPRDAVHGALHPDRHRHLAGLLLRRCPIPARKPTRRSAPSRYRRASSSRGRRSPSRSPRARPCRPS